MAYILHNCIAALLDCNNTSLLGVNRMLVEAVWRLKKWNPGWRGFAKFATVLGPGVKCGSGQRKKAIVACARLLMIDLWRLKTGRTTLEALGLIAA
jgi:hypothetical protein